MERDIKIFDLPSETAQADDHRQSLICLKYELQ